MGKQTVTIGRRFGSLVVKRIYPDNTVFCVCEPKDHFCGGERTVRRLQLTGGSILSCVGCAQANRRKGRPNVEPPLPPAQVRKLPKAECTEWCIGRLIDGSWWIAHAPSCAKMKREMLWPRLPDAHINGAAI